MRYTCSRALLNCEQALQSPTDHKFSRLSSRCALSGCGFSITSICSLIFMHRGRASQPKQLATK